MKKMTGTWEALVQTRKGGNTKNVEPSGRSQWSAPLWLSSEGKDGLGVLACIQTLAKFLYIFILLLSLKKSFRQCSLDPENRRENFSNKFSGQLPWVGAVPVSECQK